MVQRLELAIARRYEDLENEATKSEAEGADARKLKNTAEKEVQNIRDRYKTAFEVEQRPFYATQDGLGKPVMELFA